MYDKKFIKKDRNWFLAFIALIIIILGVVAMAVAVFNIPIFHWWSLLIGFGGLVATGSGVMSIIKDDPTWILLGLILPG